MRLRKDIDLLPVDVTHFVSFASGPESWLLSLLGCLSLILQAACVGLMGEHLDCWLDLWE